MEIRKNLSFLSGRVYVDPKISGQSQHWLLHISDTPVRFFPVLKKIIAQVQPKYIVHTGDLVDNIKLELYPKSLNRYERDVKQLLHILEQNSAQEVYVALGNHDHLTTIQKYVTRTHIVQSAEVIPLDGVDIAIGHNVKTLHPLEAALYLFGHDLSSETYEKDGKYYFNGILDINLIDLSTLTYHLLPYPWGTDDERLCRGRIGF